MSVTVILSKTLFADVITFNFHSVLSGGFLIFIHSVGRFKLGDVTLNIPRITQYPFKFAIKGEFIAFDQRSNSNKVSPKILIFVNYEESIGPRESAAKFSLVFNSRFIISLNTTRMPF